MSGDVINDEGLKHLASLASLKELDIKCCGRLTAVGIGHLASGELRQLETLDVNCCGGLRDWIETDAEQTLSR